jgi:hypothetical protein
MADPADTRDRLQVRQLNLEVECGSGIVIDNYERQASIFIAAFVAGRGDHLCHNCRINRNNTQTEQETVLIVLTTDVNTRFDHYTANMTA